MAVLLAISVFLGFARTFYLAPLFPEAQEFAPPEPFFFFHGAVFTAWIIVLLAQVWLVRVGDIGMHRKDPADSSVRPSRPRVSSSYPCWTWCSSACSCSWPCAGAATHKVTSA